MLLGGSATADAAAPAATASAKTLFKAGAEAYAENNFLAALHAFDAARALVPDAALTFSIAQAHRRQYYVDQQPAHLRSAVAEYRRYLGEVKTGGRRADADEALAELEPKLAALTAAAPAPEGPARVATRLMVLSSVTGADVTIDDGQAEKVPYIGEIEPGTHRVRVHASGYRAYERTVALRAGDVMPIDAELEDLPAQLLVRGEQDATVWIDGRPLGALPLAAPIAVTPGRRLVAVTKDGFRRFELETRLDRDEHKDLAVALESTSQRTASVVTLVLAGGCLAAGGIFAGVAADAYNRSKDVYDRSKIGNIDASELDAYNQSRTNHEPWTVAAVATGAVGVVLGLTGTLLFVLDEPAAPSQVATRPDAISGVGLAIGVHGSPDGAELGAAVRF